MQTIWFKIAIIPTFFSTILSLFFPFAFAFLIGQKDEGFLLHLYNGLLYFYLSFLPVIFTLYCIYFTAKTYRTLRLQRIATFKEYLSDFLLILFFPIGLWILQPKINKMMIQDKDNSVPLFD